VLEKTIRSFPWPKSMRWGAGSLKWVRPLHSILCILTDDDGTHIVPLDIDGIASGATTSGHRFMAPKQFKVTGFDDYVAKLQKANVVLDSDVRAEQIWTDASTLAFAQGLDLVEDKPLLAEVAGLVEWPIVLIGDIDATFLDLPPEVLQTSMREHQKFFSLKNRKTGRIEKFITVANIATADNGATILAGNQKVLAARLSDAKFFWENDLRVAKAGMGDWLDALQNVTFHNKLGSQAERVQRIAALARKIAPLVGAEADEGEAAAKVAKADLMSQMVTEFPELQGVMGRYYAKTAGLSDAVANVAQEHYAPLGPSDEVPTAPVSVAVALADKIDTLTGFWAIDEKPTGSKDPFALRRAALGVIRLVLENGVRCSVSTFVGVSFTEILASFPKKGGLVYLRYYEVDEIDPTKLTVEVWDTFSRQHNEEEIYEGADPNEWVKLSTLECRKIIQDSLLAWFRDVEFEGDEQNPNSFIKDTNNMFSVNQFSASLLSFLHDRLKTYLRDRNIRHDIIDACIAMPANDDLTLLVKRATALSDFLKTDDGENLLQGFKRANNILTQAEAKDGVEYSYGADKKFLKEDAEKSLFAALTKQSGPITDAIKAEDFAAAMTGLASLRAPIDAFFEAVQVNDDSSVIRRNRLNMLSDIRKLCLSVADLTRIEG